MNAQKRVGVNLKELMALLASEDGMVRQKAREYLVAMGGLAVDFLIHALLYSKDEHVRWEAAKTLGAIHDARAIVPLLKALEDSDIDVAWLAADALHNFKKEAWPPLFQVLIDHGSDSTLFRRGVHHVLANQNEDGFNDLLALLIRALEPGAVPESASVAANEILVRMNNEKQFIR